jgi:uncharacterized protein (TIGR02757 family)
MSSKKQKSLLKTTLNQLYNDYAEQYQRSPEDFFAVRQDPIEFPHRYSDFHNIEAAAFLSATFAYGKVASLCAFVDRLLQWLAPSPYDFLSQGPAVVQELAGHKPYYRLHKSTEILALLTMLSRVYSEHGSLREIYLASYYKNSTTKDRLAGFVDNLTEIAGCPLTFLVPSPSSGSPCKRLNLFLRWMVRRDGLDFGLWREVSPSDLIMPLDTHIGRVAYRLGWIETPSLSWRKAELITEVLREFDPADPTRYDFALCHESIARSEWLKTLVGETA